MLHFTRKVSEFILLTCIYLYLVWIWALIKYCISVSKVLLQMWILFISLFIYFLSLFFVFFFVMLHVMGKIFCSISLVCEIERSNSIRPCERTTPSAKSEVSVVRIMGPLNFGNCKMGRFINFDLRTWKECWHCSDRIKGWFFLSKCSGMY